MALWSDWERRNKLVPQILGLEKYGESMEVLEHILDGVQKAVCSVYLKTSNDIK
jgi:hypothetical protein